MYKWDIYEITSEKTQLHGVKLRGCIRKYSLINKINLLIENASDKENAVRFAVENNINTNDIISFIKTLSPDLEINLIQEDLINPVLSKMKVNIEDRYEI
jgi:hypothetical protein